MKLFLIITFLIGFVLPIYSFASDEPTSEQAARTRETLNEPDSNLKERKQKKKEKKNTAKNFVEENNKSDPGDDVILYLDRN